MEAEHLHELLAPFRAINAHVSVRIDANGNPFVHGIQCRDRPATDEHAALLPAFPDLHAVGLEGSQITDAALTHLASLRRLDSLELDRTVVTDAGLAHLAYLPWLEFLHIEHTRVSKSGVMGLQAQLRKCVIVSDWT